MKILSVAFLMIVFMSACKKDTPETINNENEFLVLTDQTFESEVKNGAGVAFVLFHAEWCSACKQVIPDVEEAVVFGSLSEVTFGEIDHVDFPDVFTNEGISGFPKLVIYKDGVQQEIMSQGSQATAEDIRDALLPYL